MLLPIYFLLAQILESVEAQEPCIDYNSSTNLCYDCAHDQYRAMDFIINQSIFLANCSLRKDAVLNLDVYISNEKCKPGTSCNGTESSPFDEISKAFFTIGNLANQYFASFVNFYFLGSPHYILRRNLPVVLPFGFFRHVNISMSMTPCFCSFKNINPSRMNL